MQFNNNTTTHSNTTCTCRRHETIPSVPRTKRTQRIAEHNTHTRCVCTTVHTQCRCTTSTDTVRVDRGTVHHGHHAKTSQMHDLPTRHWMYDVCVLTGRPNTTVVRLEANGARMVVWRTFPADVGHDTTTSQYACAPLHVNKQKTHVTQSQPRTTIRESVHSKHLTASTCERTTHNNTNACYSNAPLNLPKDGHHIACATSRPCNTFSITTLSLSRTHLRVHLNRSLQKLHQQTFVR